jgi:hypothetical protein
MRLGERLALDRREVLQLRVPALRAKANARDTSLRMTAQGESAAGDARLTRRR